jgi:hypothetical protein
LRRIIRVGKWGRARQRYARASLDRGIIRVPRGKSQAMGLRGLVLGLLRRLVRLLLGVGAGKGDLAGGQCERHDIKIFGLSVGK